jgi:hypothetical protein
MLMYLKLSKMDVDRKTCSMLSLLHDALPPFGVSFFSIFVVLLMSFVLVRQKVSQCVTLFDFHIEFYISSHRDVL